MKLKPAKSKGIDITFYIQDDIEIFTDSNTLQSVIHNFVSNAMKFEPKCSEIILSAKVNSKKSIEYPLRIQALKWWVIYSGSMFRPIGKVWKANPAQDLAYPFAKNL